MSKKKGEIFFHEADYFYLSADIASNVKLRQKKTKQPNDIVKKSPFKNQKLQDKKHYEGHRQRLRQRFIETNGDGLADYEFLELLLFRSVHRADTKPLAKALLQQFGTLADVFGADQKRLIEVKGCGEAIALDLKIIGSAIIKANKASLNRRNIFSSWDNVLHYCTAVMAHESTERLRILFLDKKNGLIADEIHQTGTIDHIPIYPREIIKRALELNSSSMVLFHNHPSGDPTPSREDISITIKLVEIARSLNITILDHLIIGKNGYVSLKALDLI